MDGMLHWMLQITMKYESPWDVRCHGNERFMVASPYVWHSLAFVSDYWCNRSSACIHIHTYALGYVKVLDKRKAKASMARAAGWNGCVTSVLCWKWDKNIEIGDMLCKTKHIFSWKYLLMYDIGVNLRINVYLHVCMHLCMQVDVRMSVFACLNVCWHVICIIVYVCFAKIFFCYYCMYCKRNRPIFINILKITLFWIFLFLWSETCKIH